MQDWKHIAVSHELLIPDFAFDCGERANISLKCCTLGQLSPAMDNGVLVLHGTTGSSSQFLQPIMADPLFADGAPLDCRKYFIIVPDAIGHGESSKPSNENGKEFPQYSYHDIVRAQHAIVEQLFGIDRLRLILGTSMGGMNTWLWGILYSEMAAALMPVACLPRKVTGLNLLFRRLMLAIIEGSCNTSQDINSHKTQGMGFAWDIFHLLTLSPAQLHRDILDPSAADKWLAEAAAQAKGTSPLDVLWEFRASLDYDPVDDLHKITAPLLSVNFVDDQINSPGFAELADDVQGVAHGDSVIIDAGDQSYGHQTHSKAAVWKNCVSNLLNTTG